MGTLAIPLTLLSLTVHYVSAILRKQPDVTQAGTSKIPSTATKETITPGTDSLLNFLGFNGHFPGEPGLAGHHQQTNTQFFYRSDALLVTQPTVSKHWKENITFHRFANARLTWGSSNFCLTTNSSWCYLGEGCHASHQPSDASTPVSLLSKLIINRTM